MWVEPDVRDEIIDYVEHIVLMSNMTKRLLVFLLGITASRFYDWMKRSGVPNQHNGFVPRKHWILPEERKAIIDYCQDKLVDAINPINGWILFYCIPHK